jgi:hypothetical protein
VSFADLCSWTAEMAPLTEGAFGEPMPEDPQCGNPPKPWRHAL